MRKLTILLVTLSPLFAAKTVAEDGPLHLSIPEVMEAEDFKGKLTGEVRFYFGDQLYPVPKAHRGEAVADKSSRAFNKAPETACTAAFQEAMLALQARAEREGGNEVVDIVSYLDRNEFVSASEYLCNPGTLTAGVALKGSVVTLP